VKCAARAAGPPRPYAAFAPGRRVTCGLLRQSAARAWVDNSDAKSVNNHFRARVFASRHDGQLVPHRLEVDDPKALAARRHYEDVDSMHKSLGGVQSLTRPRKCTRSATPCATASCLKLLAPLSFAHDVVVCFGKRPSTCGSASSLCRALYSCPCGSVAKRSEADKHLASHDVAVRWRWPTRQIHARCRIAKRSASRS